MNNFFHSISQAINAIAVNAPFVLKIIALLWAIQLVNWLLRYHLNILGIHPRRILGLPGIVCAPFLHGSFVHLLMNSIPLFILASFTLIYGMSVFIHVTIVIVVLSGLLTWLFGRSAIHIGASGVIMGYFGFLLSTAYYHHSAIAVISAAVCLFYLGGMLAGILPTDDGTSWEGHLFGFISGLASIFLLVWV